MEHAGPSWPSLGSGDADEREDLVEQRDDRHGKYLSFGGDCGHSDLGEVM